MNELEQAGVHALERGDDATREGRARRLAWLAQFQRVGAVAYDRLEPMGLLEEARACYVNGNNIAVLLCALAFIEQTVMEELELARDTGPRDTLHQALASGRKARLFPADVFDRIDRLREKRNPFTHRKSEGHKHSLSVRFRVERRHPKSILEDDANESIELMYEVFYLVLRTGVE